MEQQPSAPLPHVTHSCHSCLLVLRAVLGLGPVLPLVALEVHRLPRRRRAGQELGQQGGALPLRGSAAQRSAGQQGVHVT